MRRWCSATAAVAVAVRADAVATRGRAACTRSSGSAPAVAGHTSGAALHTQARARTTIMQHLRGVADSKLANAYKPGKFTSKSIGDGPQAGVGFDPVNNHYLAETVAGVLRRKHGSSAEDYLDVDELGQWMEAKHAAKVLDIKEEDLPVLTKAVLEEKWRAAYKRAPTTHREEVLVATEVLLEYTDSSLKVKKSKQYYRNFLQNARLSVDAELKQIKSEKYVYMMYWLAFTFTIGSSLILFVAYFRNYVSRKDAAMIGARVNDFVNMTFLQSSNLEAPPDYNTRYLYTPSAMDMDQKAGRYDKAFLDSHQVRTLEEQEQYNRREEADMLRMLNDANELAGQGRRNTAAARSRVSVVLAEDAAKLEAPGEAARAETTQSHQYSDLSFRQFAGLMARGFGGGSRFQRMTNESAAKASELEKMRANRDSPTSENSSTQ